MDHHIKRPVYERVSNRNLEPDLDWEYEDKAGHLHQWIEEDGNYSIPSCRWIEAGPEWGHYECCLCKERLVPPREQEEAMDFRVGSPRYYIDDKEVTEKVFQASVAKNLGILWS